MTAENNIAKLRILRDRAQREETAAAKIKKAETDAAHAKYYPFSEALIEANFKLYCALEANGQCGVCEKPKKECKGHTLWAAHATP